MAVVTRPRGQLHAHGSAPMSRAGSAVGRRDPVNSAKVDPLVGKLPRLLHGGFAVNAVRIDLAVVNAPRLLGKAVADIIAVRLHMPAHLDQSSAELGRGNRWSGFPRAGETRRHDGLLDRGAAAFGAGDLTSLLLCLEPVPVTKPRVEFMAVSTTQREQDHRHHLLAGSCIPAFASSAIVRQYG